MTADALNFCNAEAIVDQKERNCQHIPTANGGMLCRSFRKLDPKLPRLAMQKPGTQPIPAELPWTASNFAALYFCAAPS